jgi:hypothetical protein
MTLKEQIQKIVVYGRREGWSDEFVARAILLHFDNKILSLVSDGWLDDDEETSTAFDDFGNQYDRFLADLGI